MHLSNCISLLCTIAAKHLETNKTDNVRMT